MAITTKLQNLENELKAACQAYVNGYNAHKGKKALKELKEAATNRLSEYNAEFMDEAYRDWLAEKGEDIVYHALTVRDVPHCKAVKYKTDDNDVMTYAINDANIAVDFVRLEKIAGADKFHDPNWHNMVCKLAQLWANYLNEELGDNAAFSYKIDESAETFEFPEGINPVSEEGVQVALQQVFDAICYKPVEVQPDAPKKGKKAAPMTVNAISLEVRAHRGDGKKYSSEWTNIRESMTRAGGRRVVNISGTGKMTELIADCMSGIINGAGYSLSVDK